MTDPATIDIVIPTYCGADRVADCVQRLGSLDDDARLWLIDDASPDGTAERLRREHPGATVLERPVNGGFAQAADAGLRAGNATYVVLLNDDLLPEPGFVGAIVAPLRTSRTTGMVAPLLLRADGEKVEGVGIEADATVAGFSRCWDAPRDDLERTDHRDLLGPSGGAAAYRRAALDAVDYLDLGIGSYSEDLDLALRIRTAGWDARPALDAVAVHLGSQTFGRRSTRQLYAKGYSRGYLLRKYGVLRRRSTIAPALLGESAILARQLLRDHSLAGLRGRVAGWRAGALAGALLDTELLNRDIGILDGMRRRKAYGG